MEGRLPSDNQRRCNEALLRVFTDPKDKCQLCDNAVLLALFPGDWTLRDTVELWLPPGWGPWRYKQYVVKRSRRALCREAPTSFPSNKWQKVLDAPHFFGRLLVIHSLGEDVYEEMCSMLAEKDGASHTVAPGNPIPLEDIAVDAGHGQGAEPENLDVPGLAEREAVRAGDQVMAKRLQMSRFRKSVRTIYTE